MATGYKASSSIPVLGSLLSRRGMTSIVENLWIIVCAVTFRCRRLMGSAVLSQGRILRPYLWPKIEPCR